jgi:predicted nucleic acid-binding protein
MRGAALRRKPVVEHDAHVVLGSRVVLVSKLPKDFERFSWRSPPESVKRGREIFVVDEIAPDHVFLARPARARVRDDCDRARVVHACRDPRDDKFLEVAVNGRADLIITGDRDLLALHSFMGVAIISPAAYLSR